MAAKLSIREIRESDLKLIVGYWHGSDNAYLHSLGVDLDKLPTREGLTNWLLGQMQLPIENRHSYCLIWELDNQPLGHCNTNPTKFGKEAYMHLHIWESKFRRVGLGHPFLKASIQHFFEKLCLKELFCEPFALNPAPNKVLEKAGFTFIKEHTTTPGTINFEQRVKLWRMGLEEFGAMAK